MIATIVVANLKLPYRSNCRWIAKFDLPSLATIFWPCQMTIAFSRPLDELFLKQPYFRSSREITNFMIWLVPS